MAVYKNNDNWENSRQYIIEQLFPYDYNNDVDTLKMKIWVLDGKISKSDKEAGYVEDDINDPKNHFASLNNELIFLDRYIRTTEDNLDTNELNFQQLKEQREKILESWINTINPETGEYYKSYELTYSSRPTLLSDSDFETLYQEFKSKRSSGELSNAFEIINKITDYCIDDEIYNQEITVENTQDSATIESNLKDKGEESAKDNDNNYVNQMNRLYDEIIDIIDTVEPVVEDSTSKINIQLVLVNLSHRRESVSLDNTSTHKGIIASGGGYRFSYKDVNKNDISLTVDNSDLTNDKTGDVEWLIDEWIWAEYYEDADTGSSYLEFRADKNDLPSEPGTEQDIGNNTIERHSEITTRWKNTNRLREDRIQNTGTRVMIESMVTANIPDLKSDQEDHLSDKNNQKVNYTKTLQEIASEFN